MGEDGGFCKFFLLFRKVPVVFLAGSLFMGGWKETDAPPGNAAGSLFTKFRPARASYILMQHRYWVY